jgi:hypothetical protein
MNHLSDIIHHLDKEEIRSYKLFASRIQFENSDGKITKLFDLVKDKRHDEDDDALIKFLFGSYNHNAHYRLKNRLTEDVQRSLLMHHYNLDGKINTINQIILARIYSYKGGYKQSFNFLKRAEKKAEEGSFYDLLNIIYDEILVLCKSFHGINPDEYIDKQESNSKRLQKILRTNALIASLNYQLRQTNFSGKDANVLQTISRINRKLNIGKDVTNLADTQFQIHECVKNALLFKKDFASLEEYLSNSFKQFSNQKLFTKDNYDKKIVLLIWLVNTCYKNRHFKQMNPYLNELNKSLNEFNKLFFDKYIWAYNQGRMLYYVGTNEISNAINLLEEYKLKGKQIDVMNYDVNVYFNLSTCYFFESNLKKANENIGHLLKKNIYTKLSAEMRLAVDIVDLILQIELNEDIYAEHKLNEIKRVFKSKLNQSSFEKEKEFLKIIPFFIFEKNVHWNKTKQAKIDEFMKKYYKLEPGSNEAIHYTLWIQSKLKNENYYSLLLNELSK